MTLNNCVIVGAPHGDVDTMTVVQFKDWLKNIPVRIESLVEVQPGIELLTSYLYKFAVTEIEDDESSNNEHTSDSDWEPKIHEIDVLHVFNKYQCFLMFFVP